MSWPAERLPAADWIDRCASQLTRTEPAIDATAALALATEIFQFPRTAAMAPEAAVEFVAHQLTQAVPRFDRRLLPR